GRARAGRSRAAQAGQIPLRISDDLWDTPRPAGTGARRWRHFAGLRAVRHRLVPLLHAAPLGAPGKLLVRAAQFARGVRHALASACNVAASLASLRMEAAVLRAVIPSNR